MTLIGLTRAQSLWRLLLIGPLLALVFPIHPPSFLPSIQLSDMCFIATAVLLTILQSLSHNHILMNNVFISSTTPRSLSFLFVCPSCPSSRIFIPSVSLSLCFLFKYRLSVSLRAAPSTGPCLTRACAAVTGERCHWPAHAAPCWTRPCPTTSCSPAPCPTTAPCPLAWVWTTRPVSLKVSFTTPHVINIVKQIKQTWCSLSEVWLYKTRQFH